MTYAATHSRAHDLVRRKGAAVTFTTTTQAYDPATDTLTPTTSTVAGQAVQVAGDPERYRDLGLIETEARTLLVAPTTFGQVPAVGAAVTWGGVTWTVRWLEPVAPDGTAIVVEIVVSR